MAGGDGAERLLSCEAAQAVSAELISWRWVARTPGPRSGLTEFTARRHLFAHVVEDWGDVAAVGLLLPDATAARVVASGAARWHPIIPAGGWILIELRSAEDFANAIGFAREAYERAVPQLTAI